MGQATTTLESDLPGWTPPLRQPSDDPLDSEATTTLRQGRPPEDDELVGDDLPPPGPTSTSKAAGPSPASTDPKAFLAATSALVGIATMGVHYARRAPEGVWLADDDDMANIAEPLARIAARHSPVSGTEANDLGDALAATVGLAHYGLKNVAREAEAKGLPLEQRVERVEAVG